MGALELYAPRLTLRLVGFVGLIALGIVIVGLLLATLGARGISMALLLGGAGLILFAMTQKSSAKPTAARLD